MSTVENKVVKIQFDNADFQRKIAETLRSLEALNKGLKLEGAAKGLSGLTAESKKVDLKHLEGGVDNIAGKFKAMSVVGVAALATIVASAVSAGAKIVNALTLKPAMDGFREYETNINAIQTILANTAAAGTNLKQVNAALDELNHYADQTIYSFAEMAKNVGTFTAAGVGLKPAVQAIKGIANLAALSGSNSSQASTAMYQLSQAISAGRVSLEDWNSVVNAGMGGTVFQRALAQNAEKMGALKDGAVKLKGEMKNVTINGQSFRESITAKPGEKSWLTSDVLTQTLAQFTGDLTDAQLAAEGFNKSEIKAIQQQAKTAQEAATQVKTFSQLVSTLGEAASSGWSSTWRIIFGDFNEARTLFTNVSNTLGAFVSASANARNKVLGDWAALGGRKVIIEALGNAWKALLAIAKPIRDAYRDIFPAATGKQLYDLSVSIRDFAKGLTLSSEGADKVRRIFAGLFAILDIGWQVVKNLVVSIFDLTGAATENSGSFVDWLANAGDFLVRLDEAVKKGDGLVHFFQEFGHGLEWVGGLLSTLTDIVVAWVKGADLSGPLEQLKGFGKVFEPLAALAKPAEAAWHAFLDTAKQLFDFFTNFSAPAFDFFDGFSQGITDFVDNLDVGALILGINTALFVGLGLLSKNMKNLFKHGPGGFFDDLKLSFKSVGDSIRSLADVVGLVPKTFGTLTDTLKTMQNTLRAATLLEIAAAVGIMVASMNTLSKIDVKGLTSASAAITVLFTELLAGFLIFEKMSGLTGFIKMPFIASSMILLATAILILSQSVKQLSGLNWQELATGLTGTLALVAGITAATQFLPSRAGLVGTGLGVIVLAVGIKILASAVKDLSGLGWEEMARGLTGVSAILVALGLFGKFANVGARGVIAGAALITLATGIKILAGAMKTLSGLSFDQIAHALVAMAGALVVIAAALNFIPLTAGLRAQGVVVMAYSLQKIGLALEQTAKLSWAEIGRSLAAMGGALAIIAGFLMLLPASTERQTAAMVVVAISLNILARALQQMGSMDWESIGKAMTVLAGSLLIIGVAVTAMTASLAGAAALLVISASLAVLAPVLLLFGKMSWEEVGRGLLTLAGAFVVLGLAGLVLTPVVPTLLGLGLAVTLFGAGLLAAGTGILAFSAGLTALGVASAAATAGVVTMVAGITGLLPMIARAIALAIVAFAKAIADSADGVAASMVQIMMTLIGVVNKLTPALVDMLLRALLALLRLLAQYAPQIDQAGAHLVISLLQGMKQYLPKIVTVATDLILAFIQGISNNLQRIIRAGSNLIIQFVNGLASEIRRSSPQLGAAGANLALAIVDGMASGLSAGVGVIASRAREVAKSALDAAKGVLGIASPSKEFEKIGRFVNDGFRKGLDGNRQQIYSAFDDLKKMLLDLNHAAGAQVDSLEKKLASLNKNKKKNAKAIAETKRQLAQAKIEEARTKNAFDLANKGLAKQNAQLSKMADQYDAISAKLDVAKQKLVDATKTRDDYSASIRDQYNDLPEVSGQITLAQYVDDLRKQIAKTQEFAQKIQKLRTLGLNDALYKDLLAKGPDSLPFIDDLLAAGKKGVDTVNALGGSLEYQAKDLGLKASSALYQAGVDAAAGLVKGLQAQQATLEKMMDKLADAMVKAIKAKLGIKSPSREFAKIGGYSVEGLAKGLLASSSIAEKSAEQVGDAALDALQKSLSKVVFSSAGGMDLRPAIRPVLDLTDVASAASKIPSLLSAQKMTVAASYGTASALSAAIQQNQSAQSPEAHAAALAGVNYTQNNYSPKALSDAEIYRQTKNQLSVLKTGGKTP